MTGAAPTNHPDQALTADSNTGCAITLYQRIAELSELHGSLRNAARELGTTPSYLSRLASGEKTTPGEALLNAMGLRQIVTYERERTTAALAGSAQAPIAMKERPILFSAPMVRALLAGTKTQTRRVVKWRGLQQGLNRGFSGLQVERSGSNWVLTSPTRTSHEYRSVPMPRPYGEPGDRLWVRETFQPLFADGFDHYTSDWETGKGYAVRYVATDGRAEWIDGDDNISDRCKPAIHMPRWASRITLEITDVRVERLQDISEADAIAEGVSMPDGTPTPPEFWSYRQEFGCLWQSINGPGSWDANHWVWVIEFKRVLS